jgi:Skp family chaperone for outer membrane proteins
MTDADWRNGRTRDDLLAMLTFVQGRWDERQGRLFGAAVMRRVWDLLTDPRYRGLVVALERWVTGVTGESDYVAARQRLPAIANWRTAGIVNFRELPYWVQQTHSATVALGDFDLRVVVLSAAAARANHTAEQSAELKPFDEQIAAIDRDSDRFQREYDDAVWRGMSSAERKGETLRLRREQADVQIRQLRAEQRELRQQLDAAARDSEHAAQADLLRCVAGSPFTSAVFAPRWRSETVALLVRGIVADRAFDRLPVLADALEEAGCDHPDVLSHCRTPGPHAVGCWVLRGLAESGGRS